MSMSPPPSPSPDLLSSFLSLTGSTSGSIYLSMCDWDLSRAVSLFYDQPDLAGGGGEGGATGGEGDATGEEGPGNPGGEGEIRLPDQVRREALLGGGGGGGG
ncbi:hypothetical protein ScalyP_jg9452, partial [Parmales sp. scaly parma]